MSCLQFQSGHVSLQYEHLRIKGSMLQIANEYICIRCVFLRFVYELGQGIKSAKLKGIVNIGNNTQKGRYHI